MTILTATRALAAVGVAVALMTPAAIAAPSTPTLVASEVMTGTLPAQTYGVNMVANDDASSIYVATQSFVDSGGGLGVHRFDGVSGRLLASAQVTPPRSNPAITGLALDPARSRLWLLVGPERYIFDSESLSVVTSMTHWDTQLIDMVPSPTSGALYGLTSGLSPEASSRVVELDPATGVVLREVAMTDAATRRNPGTGYLSASRLLIDPSGGHLYALPRDGTDLVKVETASMTVKARVSGGATPDSMALSPTSGQVFVADVANRLLRRFDMTTLAEQGSSPLRGRCPGSLVTDALGERAVVGNPCGGDPYQVFDPRTGQDLSAPFAQGNGMSLLMNPEGTLVYALDSGGASAVTGFRLQTRQEVAAARKSAIPLPTAPRSVSASLSGTTVSVTWAAPANSRRSRISRYVVTARPGGATCTTRARTTRCTIGDLERGRTYAFTVKAKGATGMSPAAISRFVPVPLPAPPRPPAPDPKPQQELS